MGIIIALQPSVFSLNTCEAAFTLDRRFEVWHMINVTTQVDRLKAED